ncbi:GDP-fucose transporter 1-like [Clavelina lepadiformis]|uniref:Sugar phosphate transporter domain-containing protein n=1 Tax=Clavelina lepadiformis TaxID=159417 RepID=A0ABP0FUE5_CLALP
MSDSGAKEMNKSDEKHATKKDSLMLKYLKVAGAVSLYWTVSITMVFLNKYLLKSDLQLDAPMFVTWFQCVVTVFLCAVCGNISARFPNLITFPSAKVDQKLSREALPLTVVFVGMITLNNLCLREVGVSFYTIARSLVTIFSIIFTYFILGKTTSARALMCCGIVLSGFFLGVNQEALGDMSVKGVIYGVAASALVALNAIYIKKVLPAMDNNIWKLTYYNNLNAIVIFIPLVLLSEFSEVLYFEHLFEFHFWCCMFAAGFLGFIMGYVVGLQIKVTNPVTHTVSGVAKACFQTVLAVIYFQETKTGLWWFSNMLVLTGTGLYSVVRSLDMKRQHDQQSSKHSDEDNTKSSEKKSLIA